MNLQPHQQRVVDEKSELDTKIGNLDLFIEKGVMFEHLPEAEQQRLHNQRVAMKGYSDILGERIAAFNAPPAKTSGKVELDSPEAKSGNWK